MREREQLPAEYSHCLSCWRGVERSSACGWLSSFQISHEPLSLRDERRAALSPSCSKLAHEVRSSKANPHQPAPQGFVLHERSPHPHTGPISPHIPIFVFILLQRAAFWGKYSGLSLTSFSFPHPTEAILVASLLFLAHTRPVPAVGLCHRLLLPGMSFPGVYMANFITSSKTVLMSPSQ